MGDNNDEYMNIAKGLGINEESNEVVKTATIAKIDTLAKMSDRELLVKRELIKFVRYQCSPRLELFLRRAFDDGVVIREIEENFYFCFNRRTRKYMKNLNAVMKSDVEICTQEISDTFWMTYFLATVVPDGEGVKCIDDRISAREKYRQKLLTPEIQNAIYDSSHDFEDADLSAKDLPEDSAKWIKLFKTVAQNKEMSEVLQYVRACKATLKPHSKYGYYIDRSLFSDRAKETYEKHIKPYFEEHSAELFAALKEIAK